MKLKILPFNKLFSFYTGDEASFNIEQRLFNMVSFVSGIIGVGCLILNIFIGSSLKLTVVAGLVAIICWLAFYFSRFRNKFIAGRWILTMCIYAMLCYLFFINNGSRGPLLYLYMVYFLFLLFIWNGKERLIITIVFLLNIATFLFVELKFPDIIQLYDSEKTRILDNYLSYFLFIILVGIILMFAKNSYIKEKKKAEQSDHLKSAFLANMSHEIRTPMNAILGFTQLLYKDLPKKKREEFLNIIHDNSHSLLRLIEDIIDISKIEAGELTFKIEDCDLNTLIGEIVLTYNEKLNEYPEKQVRIIDEVPQIGLMIEADSTRLKQVILNLMSNSFKFTEKGIIQIGYHLKGEFISFIVKDTGSGIKEEYINEIFDRFRKIDTEDSFKIQPGTGIGLTITKNLVRLMGGTIGVESKYGVGSAFNFTIPYKPSAVKKIDPVERISNISQDKFDFSGKTILVAEDERTNFEFLKKVIERTGAKIIHAGDGEQAIDLYKENNKIDLILMDIMMPVMNGFDASKIIKEFNPSIPIIAQTALAMEGDAERVLGSGCDDYVSKPIRMNELLRKMRFHIEK